MLPCEPCMDQAAHHIGLMWCFDWDPIYLVGLTLHVPLLMTFFQFPRLHWQMLVIERQQSCDTTVMITWATVGASNK